MRGRDGETPGPGAAGAVDPATVARLLAQARAQGLDRLDATLLLGHVLGVGRAWLLAHDDAPVETSAAGRFAGACAQRGDHLVQVTVHHLRELVQR